MLPSKRGSGTAHDEIDSFLASYPPAIIRQVALLRRLVERAVPSAGERLRPGWRLIGYDLPITRRGTYFAYVAPEPQHVHLGYAQGILMADPDQALQGATSVCARSATSRSSQQSVFRRVSCSD